MPAGARRTVLLQVTVALVLAEVISPQRASRPYMYIEGFFGEPLRSLKRLRLRAWLRLDGRRRATERRALRHQAAPHGSAGSRCDSAFFKKLQR